LAVEFFWKAHSDAGISNATKSSFFMFGEILFCQIWPQKYTLYHRLLRNKKLITLCDLKVLRFGT